MYQHSTVNRRLTLRRVSGIICLIVAGILIAGVLIYALHPNIAIPPPIRSVLPLPTPASTCKTPPGHPGDHTDTITSSGVRRTMLIHIPPSYGLNPQPLVVFYHGYSWTAQNMENNAQTAQEADKAGFVLVFPQGLETPPTWNAGIGAGNLTTGSANDIQFTRDLLTHMKQHYCIDARRIYVTGFSLGGGMAYRAICHLSDQIAAIATVSGAYYPFPEGCHPQRPLPVMEIHGGADTQAPYNGYPARNMLAVNDYLNGWLSRDHCSQPSQTFFQQGDVTGIEWTHCASGVSIKHYRVSDGGHNWPGTPNTTQVINSNQVIWQFFSAYTLPSPPKK
ncbi:MAG: hypothetical protein J2P37_11780 [Ktedonobacteraceae bacterium]|nr:hypothetical protein [Ktedonobacteraceae bacterium]